MHKAVLEGTDEARKTACQRKNRISASLEQISFISYNELGTDKCCRTAFRHKPVVRTYFRVYLKVQVE